MALSRRNSRKNSRTRRGSRKSQRGGFIRAPTPQYAEHCGGPNPSSYVPKQSCESCASQNGGRRRSRKNSRRQRRSRRN